MGMNIRPTILRSAIENPQTASVLVGIETYNAGLMNEHSNKTAQTLADSLPLAQTGGSDAHMLWMIGLGATTFEGCSASDLRNALQQRTTQVYRCRQMRYYEFFCRYMPAYFLRLAGYVQWNPSPETPYRLWRLSTIQHLPANRRIG